MVLDRVDCDDDIPITILNLVLSYLLNFSTAVPRYSCRKRAVYVWSVGRCNDATFDANN